MRSVTANAAGLASPLQGPSTSVRGVGICARRANAGWGGFSSAL